MQPQSDEELRRSLFRHLAALAGSGLLDIQSLIVNLVAALDIDQRFVDDLRAITNRQMEQAQRGRYDEIAILAGHMSIVLELAGIAGPALRDELHDQARRMARVLDRLSSTPD